MLMKSTPGVNFINVLWAAFMHANTKSEKKCGQAVSLFCTFRICVDKSCAWNVGEIGPCIHNNFFSDIPQEKLFPRPFPFCQPSNKNWQSRLDNFVFCLLLRLLEFFPRQIWVDHPKTGVHKTRCAYHFITFLTDITWFEDPNSIYIQKFLTKGKTTGLRIWIGSQGTVYTLVTASKKNILIVFNI